MTTMLLKAGLLVLGVITAGLGSQAQVAVITHPTSTVHELRMVELKRIYAGEVTTFSSVVIQRERSEAFFRTLLGVGDHAVRQQWVRLLLAGKVPQGPIGLSSDEDVVEYVRTHPGSIGFVAATSVRDGVRVVPIEGIRPPDPAYPFR